MQITNKVKTLLILNLLYSVLVLLEETKVVEVLPFKEETKYAIKTLTLFAMGLINVLINQYFNNKDK